MGIDITMAIGEEAQRTVDEVMLEALPVVPPPRGFATWRAAGMWVADQLALVGAGYSVIPTGSLCHGTAGGVHSGLDLLVMQQVSSLVSLDPKQAVAQLGRRLNAEDNDTTTKGWRIKNVRVGTVCLIPAVFLQHTTRLMVPDANQNGWVATMPEKHAAALQAMTDIQRCAIRFLGSSDAMASWSHFAVEAVAIEAFSGKSYLEHFHWALKGWLDTAAEILQAGPSHPLTSVIASASRGDVAELVASLERVRELADRAWFMQEVDDGKGDFKEIVGCYLMILDPLLGR